MSFKNFFTGINRTGEQLINSVIARPPGDNTNNTTNQSPGDNTRPSSATSSTNVSANFNQERRDSHLSTTSSSNQSSLILSSEHSNNEISQAEGFLCPQCMAAFPNAELLTEHFSVIHSPMFANVIGDNDDEVLLCPHCRMQFINEDRLASHISQYHSSTTNTTTSTTGEDLQKMALDEQSTATLTENFSRAIQSAFVESAAAAAAASTVPNLRNENEKSEELELLANQLKVMEETKDMLLGEMAAMRQESQRKDEKLMAMEVKLDTVKANAETKMDNLRKREENHREEIEKYKNQILQNQKDLSKLSDENRNLREQNSRAEQSLNEIREKHSEQLEKLNQKLTSKKAELSKLSTENDQYKRQINEKIPLLTSQLGSPLEALLEEKKQLSTRISELETKLNQSHNNCVDLERQMETDRARLVKSNQDSTRAQLELAESERVNELNSQIDQLRSTLDQLRSEKILLEKSLRDLTDQNSNLQTDLVGSKLRFENLQLEATHSETKLAVTEQRLSETESELDKERTERVRVEQQAKELEERRTTEVEAKNKKYRELKIVGEKLQTELEQSNRTVRRLELELEQARQKLEQTEKEYRTEIEQIGGTMEQLKIDSHKQITDLSEKLSHTESALQTEQSNLALQQKSNLDEIGKLRSNLAQSKLTIVELNRKLIKLRTQTTNLIRQEIDKLNHDRRELSELVTKNCRHFTEIVQNIGAEKISELFEQIFLKFSCLQQRLTEDIVNLREKYCHLSEIVLPQKDSRLAELIESGKLLQIDRDMARNELEQLQTRETMNKERFGQLKTENAQLTAQIEKEKARFENAQQFNDKTLSEKLKLELELSTHSEEKRALLERCVANEEQLKVALVEINDLSAKLEENSKAVFELGQQNQSLQIELDEASQRLKPNWINDRLVTQCMNDRCLKTFGAMVRKHHCRRCGNIFCNECSLKTGQVTGHPKPVRVCDPCHAEIKQQ